MIKPRIITVEGYEMLEKEAKKTGERSTSCTIYVPLRWEGKKVTVISLE